MLYGGIGWDGMEYIGMCRRDIPTHNGVGIGIE